MRVTITALLLIFIFHPMAIACDDDIKADLVPDFERALLLRQDEEFREAEQLLRKLQKEDADSFCISFALARLYAIEERFDFSIAELENLLPADEDEIKSFLTYGETPWNTLGYLYIQREMFGNAERMLTIEIERSEFYTLDNTQKIKIYNNLGLSLLNMGQYDRARHYLDIAKALGSKLAVYNLDVLSSIVATLEADDETIPGIFALIVKSLRENDGVGRYIKSNECTEYAATISDTLNEAGEAEGLDIYVFERPDGMHHITLGAYVSYPRAQRIRQIAIKAGIDDAYISSVVNWKNVSQEFGCGPS
jgi:tetratricopeptide (TPR) repeat protein